MLYAFWLFFAGLIFYLRREDRREGYPLEIEATGRLKPRGFMLIPTPKTFIRSDGQNRLGARISRPTTARINASKVEPWPGAPLQPNGDPMHAASARAPMPSAPDETYKTFDGRDLIVPLRVATNYAVAAKARTRSASASSARIGRSRGVGQGPLGRPRRSACFATMRSQLAAADATCCCP